MPKNKLASFRYRVINNCLKNNSRNWTRIDMMKEIDKQLYEGFGIDKGVSKRTFHYDIELMRSLPPRGFDAPIIIKNGFYTYENPDYSIENIPLSELDIESINNAVELLSQFKQLPIHSELSLVREKIAGQNYIDTGADPIIEFEYRTVAGSEFLSPLYKMIKEKKVIKITYQSFKSTIPKEFIVHPYYLKQYNQRWYLITLNERFDNIGIYSLDRIKSVNVDHTSEFKIHRHDELTKHFKNIIGVTVAQDLMPKLIKLWISPDQAPYIITKPIHHSQVIIEEATEGTIITIEIIPNFEFFSTVLSFGSTLKILSPEYLQKEIFSKLKGACKMYEDKTED